MSDKPRWDLAQTWLAQQIAERALSKATIVRDVRLDQRTLDKVLDGTGVKRADRLAALAQYLGFRGDAFALLVSGQEPVPLGITDGEAELRFRALERRLDRIEALLESGLSPEGPQADVR